MEQLKLPRQHVHTSATMTTSRGRVTANTAGNAKTNEGNLPKHIFTLTLPLYRMHIKPRKICVPNRTTQITSPARTHIRNNVHSSLTMKMKTYRAHITPRKTYFLNGTDQTASAACTCLRNNAHSSRAVKMEFVECDQVICAPS